MVKFKLKVVGCEWLDCPTHHFLIGGLSGMGKDMTGEAYITEKVGKSKVIDFYSAERFEGFFYGIPQSNPLMLKRMYDLTGGRLKPCAFDHEIIMILGNRLKDVQTLPKNVKVVTLDQNDLTNEDLIDFVAHTPSAKGLMYMIIYFNNNKNLNLDDLELYLKNIIEGTLDYDKQQSFKGISRSTVFVIMRNIILLKNSGIFSDHPGIEKIKINDLIKDVNKISTVSCYLLSSEIEKAVVLGLLLKKFIDYRRVHKDRIHIIFYVRELHAFYRKETPIYYIPFKRYIDFVLTEGRDNLLTLVCNTQKPTRQLPPSIYTHFSKVLCHRLPFNDAYSLQNFASIPIDIIRKMQSLDKGQGIYIASGGFRYLMEIPPTRHMKKEEGFNVLAYLNKRFGVVDYSEISGSLFGDKVPAGADASLITSTSTNLCKENKKFEESEIWQT